MREALLALALATPAFAQTPAQSPSLGWLHGEWTGTATMFGRPATVTLSAEPALMGSATLLVYRATIAADASRPEFRFEGRGTYRVSSDGKVIGQWSDSQGNFHPLAGRVTGNALMVNWGETRTELGHSTYGLAADGTLTVRDATLSGGTMREFSVQSYRRK